MGATQPKKNVAIIDKDLDFQSFKPMTLDQRFSCSFHQDFQSFLQNQSLKKIQHVIVKQQNHDQHNISHLEYQNDLAFDMHAQMSRFNHKHDKNARKHPKAQLLSYIKKYSEEKLKIYILVPEISNYKLHNYQFPYITLIAEKIQTIMDHICQVQQHRGDGGAVNIKLKRMVRDLYRKVMVKVIHPQYQEKKSKDKGKQKQKPKQKEKEKPIQSELNQAQQFLKTFKKQSVSSQFFKTHSDFQKTNISTYVQYLLCLPQSLLEAIEFKRTNQFQYKIIVFAQKEQIPIQKAIHVWLIDNDINSIIKKMKNCSNISSQQKSVQSTNTIIFGDSQLFIQNRKYIEQKIQQVLGKQKFNKLRIRFTESYDELFDFCNEELYSFVICFSSTQDVIQKARMKIRQKGYHTRLHLVGLQQYPQKPNKQQINSKIKYLSQQIKFTIKFQISPLETINLYNMDEQTSKFFTNKMGLAVQNVKSFEQFQAFYIPPRYKRIIDSYHFVCNFRDYYGIFKKLFQGEEYQQTYFSKIKIIILDTKKVIQTAIAQNLIGRSVVQIHHNLNHIKTYIEYAQTQKVSMPFFAKHALSKFYDAGTQIKYAHSNGYISMKCSLTSRNQLFKQIFKSDFKVNKEYAVHFLRFPARDRSSQNQIAKYQDIFMAKYAILWKIGYDILSPDNFQILKDDIKKFFFKCKNYDLLKVSDEQFQYFYIKKVNQTRCFIQLQIACIYIYSLPHGMSQFIVDIFRRPRKTCLAIKYFCHFIITLFTAFCSFDDQIMSFQSLVLYLSQNDIDGYLKKIQQGDTLFNLSFMHCFRNQDPEQNQKNHSMVFQLQNIPFLSKTKIKNLLQIERFSFYKQSTEFLAAPYTKFQVKSVQKKRKNKYQIRLAALDQNLNKSFIHKIFEVNDITQHKLALQIQRQINSKNGILAKANRLQMQQLKKQESLYKKAQILSIHQEKINLIEEFRRGLQYHKFFEANSQQKYFTAQHYLTIKGQSKRAISSKNKNLVQIQQNHMNQMIQIQKALVSYNMSKYSDSIKYLKLVQQYLNKQKTQDLDNWRIQRIHLIRQQVEDYYRHRSNVLDYSRPFKKWTVKPVIKGVKFQIQPKGHSEKWVVDYYDQSQKFYIYNEKKPEKKMIPAKPQSAFGQQFIPFLQDQLYNYLEFKNNTRDDKSQISSLLVDINDKNKSNMKIPLSKLGFNNKQKNLSNPTIVQVSPRKEKSPFKQRPEMKKKKTQEDSNSGFLAGLFGGLGEKNGSMVQVQKDISDNQLGGLAKNNKSNVVNYQSKNSSKKNKVQKIRNRSETTQLGKKISNPTEQKNFYQKKDRSNYVDQDPSKKQFVNQLLSIYNKAKQQAFQFQKELKIQKTMQWQVFYYDGSYKLIQKGKHFKTKLHPDKYGIKTNLSNNPVYSNHQGNWQVEASSATKSKIQNNFIL